MREMLMNTSSSSSSSSSSGFDINMLVQEARNRWLKPAEVLFILQNHENHQLTEAPPQKPPSGSLFLFNKRVLRFFRKDGHSWRKKKDGRTVGEAHERLKVGTCEALNCYYAHGEHNPSFQRRSYWMLDPAYEHIVLVHYRETSERRYSAAPTSNLSPDSSLLSQNPSFYTSNPGSSSAVSELYEPYRTSFSPGSVEVSSELVVQNIGVDNLDGKDISGEYISSPKAEVSQALRRLEEQLSLNDDDTAHLFPPYALNEKPKDYGVQNCEREHGQDSLASFQFGSDFGENQQYFNESAGMTDDSYTFLQSSDNRKQPQQFGHEYTLERKDSPYWKEMLELCSGTAWVGSQDKSFNSLDRVDKPLADGLGKNSAYLAEETEKRGSTRLDLSRNYSVNRSNCFPSSEDNFSTQLSAARQFLLGTEDSASPTSVSLLQEVKSSEIPIYSSGPSTYETNSDNQTMWFDQESQPGISFSGNSTLILAEKQRFSIGEISPEWGYSTEDTKVIITGSFLCDPSECVWSCMFGDLEVPAQIIQEGVLRCHAPPHVSGKVTLCITSGNRESCSEIREFDYITKPSSCSHCDLTQKDVTKSTEELLLLVRLAQMLLCDPLVAKEDSIASGIDVLKRLKTDEDLWGYMIEGLLIGSGTSSNTLDWLIQEFVKDKLLQWLSSKYQEEESSDCSLSKKEQGIIHMVAALGFEWALIPILNAGVSINFRDINGWTALHWAARFGREKMVAALLAAGASAVAVTDPTSQDPAGKTAGSVAVASGHKGLAGYLSEVALTSRLSSLTLGETEISKGSAAVEAERTVESIESISNERLGSTEDQISLKDSLAAVRNATQAAARIQSAFRAHSFRRRQQEEVTSASYDEYGIAPEYIHSLSAASKLAFRNRDHKFDKAALSIQKKYRGWKDRKDFLAFRQKVVRIQAHVRGHQVRKKYKQFLWAVGILDKVVLRWRRRGAGLRGFKPELESIDESEDEDILKVFRKQKVNVAIEEAVSQVMSMVESPEARRQYGRMLESFRQAKAELSERRSETLSTSQGVGDMESDIDDEFNNLIQWEE